MGSILEEKRKELNLTQEEMAKQLGVTRQYYNAIENNKKQPSVDLAKQLGAIVGIEWTIFFT
ncbi:helix-turn-helix transcriptional regulator [Halalkalibacterium ligniniphilum]|uniref:helix-turn-helix transcriptional regulator n=1 Tax=Halalkalibacterium ligniniphilum TaxID=1134413 RepID=UPI00034BAA16|nr:helix-turn-helix transcriptional regulator [Halalkalibacterium ligniniphilum]